MYEELVAWLRSWSELPAHCECYESCDECDKQDICSTFTNERIITKAGEAADAIEELIAWHNADVRELGRQKILIADMRPVVLCKDCKHSAIDLENMRYCKCVVYYNHVSDDWFCADGEKREES